MTGLSFEAVNFFIALFLYMTMLCGSIMMACGWLPAAFSLWRVQVRSHLAEDRKEIDAGTAAFYTRLVHKWPVLGPCWSMRWAKGFQISLALSEYSVFMALAVALRLVQMIAFEDDVLGTADIFLSVMLFGLSDAKRRLVRASAISPRRTLRWPWHVYNCMVMGSAFAVCLLATFAWLRYSAGS